MARVQVELTPREQVTGLLHGVMRQVQSWQAGHRHRGGHFRSPGDLPGQLGAALMGVLAELAVAKYTGLYWSGVEEQGAVDVGVGVQRQTPFEVRWSASESPVLIIRPGDQGRVVLVSGGPEQWWIHGCFEAEVAKEKLELSDPKGAGFPCYVIHRDQLEPL